MTFTPVGLAFKLPERRRTALLAKDAVALQYFPKAPIKREHVCSADPAKLSKRRLRSLMAEPHLRLDPVTAWVTSSRS